MKSVDYSLLWKSVHDELNAEERQELNDWMREDENHARYYAKMVQYIEEGSSFDRLPLDRNKLWDRLSVRTGKKSRNIRYKYWLAAACSALILGFIAVWQQMTPSSEEDLSLGRFVAGQPSARLILENGASVSLNADSEHSAVQLSQSLSNTNATLHYGQPISDVSEVAMHRLVTPRGGEYSVVLEDGTRVWLNAETELRYPEAFIGNERRVELSGEAFFDVAHDSDRPFIVNTSAQEVIVYGTSFNISAYDEDDFEYTTLVEGSVGANVLGDEARLSPNEQLLFHKAERIVEVHEVDVYQYVSWKDHVFYFEGMELSSIMRVLSRWYDFDYRFDSNKGEEILFTGGFKRHDSFESIIERIELTNEVRFKVEDGRVIIL